MKKYIISWLNSWGILIGSIIGWITLVLIVGSIVTFIFYCLVVRANETFKFIFP